MLKRKWLAAVTAAVALSGCNSMATKESDVSKDIMPPATFSNPLFANGADPWLEYYDGNYYLTTTTWTSQLVMRKSPTLDGLATAAPVNVWSDADPSRCCNFWAFEFHRLNGPSGWRWYLMYTSGQHGTLDHQHLSVLESVGDDPMGPYVYKGSPMPNSWNIDGSYLEHNGQLYLLWSEWVGPQQLNFISKMTNPWSIEGPRVVLTRPEAEWEKSEREVNEGPEILKKNGRTFLIYSASFCDTPDYKLAMKELTGTDPMNPEHWTKSPEPVFQRGNGVFGPGHNGFFKSPDGTEDWIVYHGNSKEEYGCGATRSVRAQKFNWTDAGEPDFGEPIPEGQTLALPAGENGPLTLQVQGAPMQLVNAASNLCLTIRNGELLQGNCADNTSAWVVDNTGDHHVRLNNLATGEFAGAKIGGADGTTIVAAPWHNTLWQRWTINNEADGLVTIRNTVNNTLLAPATCDTINRPLAYKVDSACAQWRIQPKGPVAIASVQSGRLVQAEKCGVANSNVNQGAYVGKACQSWQFKATDLGYFNVVSANNQCLATVDGSIVPGENVELADCSSRTAQWALTWRDDGAVLITNRESQQALDLGSCAVREGANFGQAPILGTICQQFQFREIK